MVSFSNYCTHKETLDESVLFEAYESKMKKVFTPEQLNRIGKFFAIEGISVQNSTFAQTDKVSIKKELKKLKANHGYIIAYLGDNYDTTFVVYDTFSNSRPTPIFSDWNDLNTDHSKFPEINKQFSYATGMRYAMFVFTMVPAEVTVKPGREVEEVPVLSPEELKKATESSMAYKMIKAIAKKYHLEIGDIDNDTQTLHATVRKDGRVFINTFRLKAPDSGYWEIVKLYKYPADKPTVMYTIDVPSINSADKIPFLMKKLDEFTNLALCSKEILKYLETQNGSNYSDFAKTGEK